MVTDMIQTKEALGTSDRGGLTGELHREEVSCEGKGVRKNSLTVSAATSIHNL